MTETPKHQPLHAQNRLYVKKAYFALLDAEGTYSYRDLGRIFKVSKDTVMAFKNSDRYKAYLLYEFGDPAIEELLRLYKGWDFNGLEYSNRLSEEQIASDLQKSYPFLFSANTLHA